MNHKTIGIVGGGQLGRMLTQAANTLGYKVMVLDENPNSPAAQITEHIVGNVKDETKIKELAAQCDILTFEIEQANGTALQELADSGKIIHPSPKTLEIIKNKFGQKQFLQKAGIPVADFLDIKTREDLVQAARVFGYPLILKAKLDAFDGRGNALVESELSIDPAMQKLQGRELYAEKFVAFKKEFSIVAARAINGSIAVYPIFETIHQNHICHKVIAPIGCSDLVRQKVQDLAKQVLENLQGVGVFCIEMFLTQQDEILINEIAPRVHNAGHLTIEACETSQFEQHIRAITGMDLGRTDLKVQSSVMINILGKITGAANFKAFDGTWENFSKANNLEQIVLPETLGIFVHIYGKMDTKPERKMGHITILAENLDTALKAGEEIEKLILI